MQSHNSFPQTLRYWFDDAWECWHCRQNTNDALHHIVGRGLGTSTVESSILNAAPLCNQKCHLPLHAWFKKKPQIKKLLGQTYSFLIKKGYKLREIDVQFLEKYSSYY